MPGKDRNSQTIFEGGGSNRMIKMIKGEIFDYSIKVNLINERRDRRICSRITETLS